jgi:uncharacterized spore protein YtfJ
MDVQSVIEGARDAITVRRVFGEPFDKDGVTVIPAARVMGGGGGGDGSAGTQEEGPGGAASGSGTGFGLVARPVGAFVLRDGEVTWRPAIDVNRIILGAQVVAVVAFLTIRSIARSRAKAATARAAE